MNDSPSTPDKGAEKSTETARTDQSDTNSALEDQLRSSAKLDHVGTSDGGNRDNTLLEQKEPGKLDKLVDPVSKALSVAVTVLGVVKAESLEKASRGVGSVERVMTNSHIPDAVARAMTKGTDAVQGQLLKIGQSDFTKKVFESAEKVGEKIEKVSSVAEKVLAVKEGVERYHEDLEAGLGRGGAMSDAAFKAIGAGLGEVVKASFGGGAAKSFEFVTDAGARGVGIAVDAVSAVARGDQTQQAKLSDGAASGKLGAPAFYGDVAGDALASGSLDKAINRVTDAAKSGELGNLGRVGDWIGDHAWGLTHRSR